MRKISLPNNYEKQIVLISGASGAGKTTTCALLEKMYPDIYVHIPFDRSRPARPGEFGSRQVSIEEMIRKYQEGEYFNLAKVTHGGYSAIRTEDVNKTLSNGKVAVLEFPLEHVDEIEKTFYDANISIVELIPPSEEERLRRLKKGHKFTAQRIESSEWGSGRLERYKKGELLTPSDHNLALITETNDLESVVRKIHSYISIQMLTPQQLMAIEKQGDKAVKQLLMKLEMGHQNCLKSNSQEKVDKEFFVDCLHLQ
jgi:guanylate kinase